MGMHPEIHWQGNRDLNSSIQRFIGRGLELMGMHPEIESIGRE